jgi:hypothetical protein
VPGRHRWHPGALATSGASKLHELGIWQDVRDAWDAANPAPSRAAVDDLELEPTRCVGHDEGLEHRESAGLAVLTSEEAPPPALGLRRRPCRRGGVTVPEVAEPSEKPVAPERALQAVDLIGPEWDEGAGTHGLSLEQTTVRRVIGRSGDAPGCTTTQRMDHRHSSDVTDSRYGPLLPALW